MKNKMLMNDSNNKSELSKKEKSFYSNLSLNRYLLKRALISFVYPNRCPFCDAVIVGNEYFCNGCNELDEYEDISDIAAYCYYNDRSKPLIYEAKENGNGYAVSAAAFLLNRKLSESRTLSCINLVVPVPARKNSLKKRGYSFPALLARETAALINKRYSGKCLIRIRENDEQKNLDNVQRIINVKNTLGIGKEACRGLNVLVIDDVSTTGATLNEARRVLLENGAASVKLAAFAHSASGYNYDIKHYS